MEGGQRTGSGNNRRRWPGWMGTPATERRAKEVGAPCELLVTLSTPLTPLLPHQPPCWPPRPPAYSRLRTFVLAIPSNGNALPGEASRLATWYVLAPRHSSGVSLSLRLLFTLAGGTVYICCPPECELHRGEFCSPLEPNTRIC